MNMTERIIDLVKNTPEGVTNAEIAQVLGYSANCVAVITLGRVRTGVLSREVAWKTPNGRVVYRYFYKGTKAAVVAPKAKPPIVKVSNGPDPISSLIDSLAKQLADQVIVRLKTHLAGNVEQLVKLPAPPRSRRLSRAELGCRISVSSGCCPIRRGLSPPNSVTPSTSRSGMGIPATAPRS